MLLHPDDRLLCILVASGLLVAANAIPYYLQYIRTITEVQQEEKPSKGPCEDTEDALKLSTLEKLVAAPSYKLRASAVKIIAERCIKDSTRKLLLRDLASKHSTKRDRALHALWFLMTDSSLVTDMEFTQQFMFDPAMFPALVDCLCNLLPLHSHGPPNRADNPTNSSPLLPHNRPPYENLALHILGRILTVETLPNALSAGLISKWLKDYPFPCALPSNGARRQEVVKLFKTKSFGREDPLMADIITILTRLPEGLKQMRIHGLRGSSYGEAAEADVEDVFIADGEDMAGVVFSSTEMPLPPLSASQPAPWRPPPDPFSNQAERAGPASWLPPPDPFSNQAERAGPASWLPPPDPFSNQAERAGPASWLPPPDPFSNQAERAVRQRRREAAVYSEGHAPLTQDNIFQRQPPILEQAAGARSGLGSGSRSAVAAAPDATGPEDEATQARTDDERETHEAQLALALQEVTDVNLTVQQQSGARHSGRTTSIWQRLTMNLGRV